MKLSIVNEHCKGQEIQFPFEKSVVAKKESLLSKYLVHILEYVATCMMIITRRPLCLMRVMKRDLSLIRMMIC